MNSIFKKTRKDNDSLIALSVFVSFFLLYCLTVSRVLSTTHDSAGYFSTLVKGDNLLHPHHLLFLPATWLWMKLVALTGISGQLFAVESFTSFAGAVVVVLSFLIMRRRFALSETSSVALALCIGFSNGVWHYAGVVEVYDVPLAFFLGAYYFYSSGSRTVGSWIAISILMSCAVLTHQTYSMLALLLGLFELAIATRAKTSLRHLWLYASICMILIGVPYLVVPKLALNFKSWDEQWLWTTNYLQVFPAWTTHDKKWLVDLFSGTARAVVSLDPLFGFRPTAKFIASAVNGHSFIEEIFLVRNVPQWLLATSIAVGVLSGLSAIALFIRAVFRVFTGHVRLTPPILYLLLAWLVFTVFYCFWDTSNYEFWIAQFSWLWMIFGVVEGDGIHRRSWRYFAIAAGLFFSNFFGSILPATNPKNDINLEVVRVTESKRREFEPVILDKSFIISSFFSMYTRAEQINAAEFIRITTDRRSNYFDSTGFRLRLERGLTRYSSVICIENEVDLTRQNISLVHSVLREFYSDHRVELISREIPTVTIRRVYH